MAAARQPTFATVWRNLGLAYFNKRHDQPQALACFERAFALNQADARVFMELDQLRKRLNHSPQARLAQLEAHPALVEFRDDLALERAALCNLLGQPAPAYELLLARQFHPWEGGEGKVASQYLHSLVELAKADLGTGRYAAAVKKLTQALAPAYPPSLGEGKLPGAQENDAHYWLGCAYQGLDETELAHRAWQQAAAGSAAPAAALFYNDQQPDKIFYQGLALRQLGQPEEAQARFAQLLAYGQAHQHDAVQLDYFAVSLPDLLIFDYDLSRRNAIHCQYLMGLGYTGLGRFAEAATAFKGVLGQDAAHLGAHTHLALLTNLAAEVPAAA